MGGVEGVKTWAANLPEDSHFCAPGVLWASPTEGELAADGR